MAISKCNKLVGLLPKTIKVCVVKNSVFVYRKNLNVLPVAHVLYLIQLPTLGAVYQKWGKKKTKATSHFTLLLCCNLCWFGCIRLGYWPNHFSLSKDKAVLGVFELVSRGVNDHIQLMLAV